jgi:hypothetical protein
LVVDARNETADRETARAALGSDRHGLALYSVTDVDSSSTNASYARVRNKRENLRLAPEIGIVAETMRYPLNQANQAFADLRAGRFEGAVVLVP